MGKSSRVRRRQTNQHVPLVDSLSVEVADYFAQSAVPQVGQCVQAAAVLTKAAALHGIQLEPLATSLLVLDLGTGRSVRYGQRAADYINEVVDPDRAIPARSSAPALFPQGHMVVRHAPSGQVWDPMLWQVKDEVPLPVGRVAFRAPSTNQRWDFSCSEAGRLTANPFATVLDEVHNRFVWVYFPFVGDTSWQRTYDLLADVYDGLETDLAATAEQRLVGSERLRAL